MKFKKKIIKIIRYKQKVANLEEEIERLRMGADLQPKDKKDEIIGDLQAQLKILKQQLDKSFAGFY